MMSVIKFWKVSEPHGYLSNFSRHRIVLLDKFWPTSEHFFQASKFLATDPEYAMEIANAPTAMMAAQMGRDRSRIIRPDWESVKCVTMYQAIRAKFTQHKDIGQQLLLTDNTMIIEDSPVDSYWGVGADGKGSNMLGQLLMILRKELRLKGL